jgi:hypothetical protein
MNGLFPLAAGEVVGGMPRVSKWIFEFLVKTWAELTRSAGLRPGVAQPLAVKPNSKRQDAKAQGRHVAGGAPSIARHDLLGLRAEQCSALQIRPAFPHSSLASLRHCALTSNLPARSDAEYARSETGAPLPVSEHCFPASNGLTLTTEDFLNGSNQSDAASGRLNTLPKDFLGDANDSLPVPE